MPSISPEKSSYVTYTHQIIALKELDCMTSLSLPIEFDVLAPILTESSSKRVQRKTGQKGIVVVKKP
jgi:hypothetical protein